MPFVSLDPECAEELIRLQVVAVTRLARAALPLMIAQGRGAIVNVSSRLAYSAGIAAPHLPKRATYAAAKAYITAFTLILHEELAGTGVRVQALCPGIVRSEFQELVGRDMSKIPASAVMSAEDVVQASLAGLALGEVVCMPTLANPGLLAEFMEKQRQLFEDGAHGELAERYKGTL